MAAFSFDDIENAFLFVGSSPHGENSAYLNTETGKIFYQSDMCGVDEIDEDDVDRDQLIEIPHKNDLDLGTTLVFDFISSNLPDQYDRVRGIFSRKGAYGRFKDFLDSKGLLEAWHRFEDESGKRPHFRPGAGKTRSHYQVNNCLYRLESVNPVKTGV